MKNKLATLFLSAISTCAFAEELRPTPTEYERIKAESKELLERADEKLNEDDAQLRVEGLDSMDKAMRAARALKGTNHLSVTTDAAAKEAAGQKDFSDLKELVQRYETARTTEAAPTNSDGTLMLFVSFSMPPDVIREYSRQAQAAGATLVLRGNYKGGTVRRTTEQAGALNAGGAGWIINPEVFTGYKIDAVPALVLSRDNLNVDDEGCFPVGEYASVFGEMSIIGSLEKISQNATKPEMRQLAAKRLALIKEN
jgi:conjugal transfer pilus assembly protein TrbC